MMRNPAGVECPYFYGDYYRGRHQESCRLLGDDWQPALCQGCPVPGIRQANACEHMRLQPRLTPSWRWLGRRKNVQVHAYCLKSQREVKQPEIGCGQCHDVAQFLVFPGDETT